MNVIKHIICELTGYRPGAVDVSQGDRQSRAVSCRLLENGTPWMIPEGATARVAYALPDGTEGLYDSRADGTPMWEIAGNIVTVELADQLMAQAGMAQVSILVMGPDGGQLAAWPIRVNVVAGNATRLTVPENLPPFGEGFAGRIFFGGADGSVTPLAVGDGVEIVRLDDGTYALNAAGGVGEETDPTVPDWAKQPQKPAYTAQEVGAMPAGTKIPGKTSELTNDSGFVNNAVSDLVNYYTKAQMQELIAAIPRFRVTVVQQLPAAGEELVLYLVPFATAEGQYLEYIWVDGRWEVIGSQQVDLSGYATEVWVKEYVAENAAQGITWDTLKGKPTYVQTGPRVVEWSGAMDGERFVAEVRDSTATWLKISDEIPSKEELIGAAFVHSSERFDLGPVASIEDGVGCYGSNDYGILVVTQTGQIEDDFGREGVAPSTGIYVRLEGYEGQDSPYLRLTYGNYTQEKFLPQWLPDGGFGWEGSGGKTDILPETELVTDDTTQTMPMPDGGTLYGYLFQPMALALVDGKEYQITIDGVAYRRKCVLSDYYTNPMYFLGNLALPGVGEDTGEDWVFFVQEADTNYWVGMFATTSTEHKTVAISGQGTVVHQILDKFIPESIARKADIPDGGGINIPGGAEIGQTIVVKAVDDAGKPTEWEAVDMPDGGQNVEEVDLMTPANFLGTAGMTYMTATGAMRNSEAWRTYAIAPKYSRYVFRGYIPTYGSYPSVGFYSSMEPSESTFIRGITYPATAELLEIVVTEDDIPEGTQVILFSTRIASGEGSALIGTPKNKLSLLEDVVDSLVSESRGKGNVKAIFRNIPNSNDFAVIKDEIWFAQNIYQDGVATEFATIHRYKIEDGKLVHLSDIDSDFGHWNTVDYCEENDCLIFTNAANLENTDGNYFTVVKNPLALGTVARIADCGIKYSTDYGFKIQAVWGDDNFGKHNVVYLTSNYTSNIYKLMLMRDAGGELVKDANGYGSFVELEAATNTTGIGTGGGDYWNDTLYIGNGGGYGYYEMSMSDYSLKKIVKKFYYDDGAAYSGSTQGIHVDSNHIWMFVNVAGLSENYLIQYRR